MALQVLAVQIERTSQLLVGILRENELYCWLIRPALCFCIWAGLLFLRHLLMLSCNKPHLSLSQQLALLKNRGLQVADDKNALSCLHRNGYYRLSAYWYPFRRIVPILDNANKPLLDGRGNPLQKRSDQFLPGSNFDDARELYVFDKKFKMLLLDALERVEIAVRADIALNLGARDTFAHLNTAFLRRRFTTVTNAQGKTEYDQWLNSYHSAVRRSKEEFVRHHHAKYRGKYGAQADLPIWIATELWDFGQLSKFYSGMETSYRIATATRFGIPDWLLMESWLKSLNYVRNIIAHHGRLWNNALVIQPKLPSPGNLTEFDALLVHRILNTRIYFICCICAIFQKLLIRSLRGQNK